MTRGRGELPPSLPGSGAGRGSAAACGGGRAAALCGRSCCLLAGGCSGDARPPPRCASGRAEPPPEGGAPLALPRCSGNAPAAAHMPPGAAATRAPACSPRTSGGGGRSSGSIPAAGEQSHLRAAPSPARPGRPGPAPRLPRRPAPGGAAPHREEPRGRCGGCGAREPRRGGGTAGLQRAGARQPRPLGPTGQWEAREKGARGRRLAVARAPLLPAGRGGGAGSREGSRPGPASRPARPALPLCPAGVRAHPLRVQSPRPCAEHKGPGFCPARARFLALVPVLPLPSSGGAAAVPRVDVVVLPAVLMRSGWKWESASLI